MRVVKYVRVSTEDQAREGLSLAAQAAKIAAYALVKDWRVLEVIQDEGVSGKTLHRPGLPLATFPEACPWPLAQVLD